MFILVLGGNGFIGSHLVENLVQHNHKVRIFSKKAPEPGDLLPGVEYFIGNFSNPSDIRQAIQDVDAVAHLISTTIPATSNLDPIADIESNLINTVHLLVIMKESGVNRIMFISSGGTVYGLCNSLPIQEESPLKPICSYGIVKVAIENYLSLFQRLHGLSPIILRVSNPYGPRQGQLGTQGVISTFTDRIIKQEPINIWGDGGVIRDYIYITDVAKACRLALESDANTCINIGSGFGYSLNQIIRYLEKVIGKKATVHHEAARKCDVDKIILDISRANDILAWQPEISLEQGLQLYFQQLKNPKS